MDDVPLHSHVIPNPLCDVKQLQNVIETLLRKPLDNRQKNAEERNGGDHNARGGSDIFPTRPSDFFQFDTNLMKKFARALERTAHPLLQFGWLLFFFHLCHLRRHGPLPFLTSCPALRTAQTLAGEERFVPPYSVLETGVLTVGRLP